ncbi:MAG: 50S ribosomal protein L28 [candidate division SR1 bacterium]|nr:50S ribosomal protein L28 [candidate division SR1 bacterium]
MARVCDFTGRGTGSGNMRSHSMRATKRSFKVNLINKKVKLEDGSQLKLKVSSKIYKKLKGFI